MNKLKVISLLLLIFIGTGCSSVKTTSSQEKEAKAISKFLVDFEKAVISHDSKELLKLIDRNYLDEQCYGFLNGNTEQFINELFCGNLTNEDKFQCLAFSQIDKLELVKQERQDDYYTVVYKVAANGVEINADWIIIVNTVKGKIICGLEGSRG